MKRDRRVKYPLSTFISHPRSGLTWFRFMFHEIRKRHDPDNLMPPPKNTEELNPLILFDHDNMGTIGSILRLNKRRKPERWVGRKVIFLARDPRDTLLSNYHMLSGRAQHRSGVKSRLGKTVKSMDAFFRSRAFGIKRYVGWARWWDTHKGSCKDFMPIYYEDTLENPFSSLSCALEFATDENVPASIMEAAVRASSFGKMKQREIDNGRLFSDQQAAVNNDPRCRIVRKGKAGAWRDELPEELQAFCASQIGLLRGTFMERYIL